MGCSVQAERWTVNRALQGGKQWAWGDVHREGDPGGLGLNGMEEVFGWPSGEPVGMDAGKLLAGQEISGLRWGLHCGDMSVLK